MADAEGDDGGSEGAQSGVGVGSATTENVHILSQQRYVQRVGNGDIPPRFLHKKLVLSVGILLAVLFVGMYRLRFLGDENGNVPVASIKARNDCAENENEKTLQEAAVAPSRTLFLTPELARAVKKWDEGSMTAGDAQQELWKVIREPAYTRQRPNGGIVYIKTHKTGSTTIASVLQGLAFSHKLKAPLLPADQKLKADAVKYGETILHLPTTIKGSQGAPYDLWKTHIRFDNLLLDKVVPSAQGRVVSILRDPATRMRSLCHYSGCCPSSYGKPSVWDSYVLSERGRNFFKNKVGKCELDQSSKEIVGSGLNTSQSFEENFVAVVNQAKQHKFLLLVTERMIESLLVFWSEYQLHPLDVASLSKRVSTKTDWRPSNMTLEAERLMREWNPHDMKLHHLANDLLSAQLEQIFPEPADLEIAKEQLQSLNDLLFHACINNHSVSELAEWCEERELLARPWTFKHLELTGDGVNRSYKQLQESEIRKDAALHR